MTLSVLEGHFPIASLLKCVFRICGASRGSSASTELLVHFTLTVHVCGQRDGREASRVARVWPRRLRLVMQRPEFGEFHQLVRTRSTIWWWIPRPTKLMQRYFKMSNEQLDFCWDWFYCWTKCKLYFLRHTQSWPCALSCWLFGILLQVHCMASCSVNDATCIITPHDAARCRMWCGCSLTFIEASLSALFGDFWKVFFAASNGIYYTHKPGSWDRFGFDTFCLSVCLSVCHGGF